MKKLKYFSVGNISKNFRWIGVGFDGRCLFISFWRWGILYDPRRKTRRDTEKQAWEDFGKRVDQFRADHPEIEDIDIYKLALMYPDK